MARESLMSSISDSTLYHALKQVLCDDDSPNYYISRDDLRSIAGRLRKQIDKLSCCDNGSFARKHKCQKASGGQ